MPSQKRISRPLRLYLIDAHPVTLIGLRAFFNTHSSVTVVGDAATLAAAIPSVRRCKPDVVITDTFPIPQPVLRRLLTLRVLYTLETPEHCSLARLKQELEHGHAGFALKSLSLDRVLKAVQQVAAGRRYRDPAFMRLVAAMQQQHAGTRQFGFVPLTEPSRSMMDSVDTHDKPWAIWNLLSILRFHAHSFFNLAHAFQVLREHLDKKPAKERIAKDTKDFLRDHLMQANNLCEKIQLPLTRLHIERTVDGLKKEELALTYGSASQDIENIYLRIQDELRLRLLVHIPYEHSKYYTDPRNTFDAAVLDKFPSVISDVESACRCYATGNPTASVFHLMRIMEGGLRVLGTSLHEQTLDPKRNPAWEHILRKCDEELGKNVADRGQEWKADDKFVSEVITNLRTVKDAWRNPTMHVEQIYDSEQALVVFNAVRGFIRHLATKLSEGSVSNPMSHTPDLSGLEE